ncbi:hypothetical protein EXIGLDRAFT_840328 [Exidia glandulosa HHB12029]|uniref:ribonuclease Z n=1 Tax=Exidia glandulosa HHB12029 TaxID=1314781 RepID=A0A165EIR4_EXIGL|nr:hypothetical protein EXIGLDRAFT_840328 [Exidia glandulosa HHB12029]
MLLARARLRLLVRGTRSAHGDNYADMVRWAVGGVSTTSSDTDMSLTAAFEGFKYHFNIPENYSRACIQHKRSNRKTRAVFLTRIHTDTAMGLPGYLMTLGDLHATGVPSNSKDISTLKLIGPQGLGYFMNSTRSYAVRSSFKMIVSEVGSSSPEPCFKDEHLTVYAVPITAQDTQTGSLKRKRNEDDNEQPSKTTKTGNGSRGAVAGSSTQNTGVQPWRNVATTLGFISGQNNQRVFPPIADPLPMTALAYICVGPSIRGKFDAARATELGVMGALRKNLTRGESVTVANGTVVTPDMCIAPSVPPSTFFVVDCPTPDYIESLTTAPEFARHRADGDTPVTCIYYRLGDGVLSDVRFKTWMRSFGPDVHHILSCTDYTSDPLTFTSQGSVLLKVSFLDNELFPVPKFSLDAKQTLSSVPDLPANVHIHDPYLEISMHPRKAPATIPRQVEDVFHSQHALGSEWALDNDTAAAFDVAKEAAAPFRNLPAQPGDDVRVVTLGTGSSVPSMYRNLLCNLVEIPNFGNVLLDCGEGSYGQLIRRYGHDQMAGVLRSLRVVFISHNHGDHHIGLSRILSKRRTLAPDAEPLYLIATRATLIYLHEYQRIEDLGFDSSVLPINSEDIRVDDWQTSTLAMNRPALRGDSHWWRTQRSLERTAALSKTLGFSSVETVFVQHRCSAYGIVIRHQDGWSIAFSGDTRPCDSLVTAGKDVTLLIHEASMADDQEELATKKGHSTFSEALGVAKEMNAKNLILTHFSNRYPKLPVITKGAGDGDGPVVGVAFDFSSIPIGAMKRLRSYLPVVESCFAETLEEDVSAPGGDSTNVHA